LSLQLFELAGVYLKHRPPYTIFTIIRERAGTGLYLQQLGVAGFVLAVVLHLGPLVTSCPPGCPFAGCAMGTMQGFCRGLLW
jgi:hypothetical protein